MTEHVKVVTQHEVENLTAMGWKLTEILGNASEVDQRRVLLRPAGNDERGMWRNEEWGDQLVVVTRPLFVMRRDSESREVQLEKEINRLHLQLEDAKHEVDAAKADVDRAKKVQHDLAEQKVSAELERDRHKRDAQANKEQWLHADKLLNFIRKEVGEAKWREFTNEHTSCVHCIARES